MEIYGNVQVVLYTTELKRFTEKKKIIFHVLKNCLVDTFAPGFLHFVKVSAFVCKTPFSVLSSCHFIFQARSFFFFLLWLATSETICLGHTQQSCGSKIK